MEAYREVLSAVRSGDLKALGRAISIVESDLPGSNDLLTSLTSKGTPIIGLTGPPGAGKSTLLDAIITLLIPQGIRIAVIAVDPSSPFTHGALLGDRIRMSRHFDQPGVFIRSLATRGSLGGLPARCIEICDVIKEAGFDYIFIETVGVGQAEVDVAGVADKVAVVLTPENGDEVQSMKAGLLEIADVFVVNKADHSGADAFAKHLEALASRRDLNHPSVPVVKTTATTGEGVAELVNALATSGPANPERKAVMLAQRLYHIIQQKRMKDVNRDELLSEIERTLKNGETNLYRLAEKW